MISVITGLIFIIIVTRKLSPDDLGLWTLIGSLVSYVLIIRPITNYWATRQLARGEEVGKTAVITNGFFSVAAIPIYFVLAFYFAFTLDSDLNVLLLASILIPISFFNGTLNSLALPKRPQAVSYSLVIFETAKTPLGIFFVIFLQLELVGAILTIIIGESIKTIVLVLMIKEHLRGKFRLEYIKFWVRMSWLTLYQGTSTFIRNLDVMVFSLTTGSLGGLAYWTVGQVVGNVVAHSQQISQGLYPKLLATRKKEYAQENFKHLMIFSIPFLAASIVFAKPALHIVNPIYLDGIYIVILLSIKSFIFMISDTCFTILGAYETVDINKQASFKQFVKSKLFFLPTFNYISHGLYIAILFISLFILNDSNISDMELVTIWSGLLLLMNIPRLVYGLFSIKRKHGINLPYFSILKFSGISFLSSLVVFHIIEKYLIYSESVYDFLPQIIPIIILGGVLCFGILYIIDNDVRKLFNLIFQEFKRRTKL